MRDHRHPGEITLSQHVADFRDAGQLTRRSVNNAITAGERSAQRRHTWVAIDLTGERR